MIDYVLFWELATTSQHLQGVSLKYKSNSRKDHNIRYRVVPDSSISIHNGDIDFAQFLHMFSTYNEKIF